MLLMLLLTLLLALLLMLLMLLVLTDWSLLQHEYFADFHGMDLETEVDAPPPMNAAEFAWEDEKQLSKGQLREILFKEIEFWHTQPPEGEGKEAQPIEDVLLSGRTSSESRGGVDQYAEMSANALAEQCRQVKMMPMLFLVLLVVLLLMLFLVLIPLLVLTSLFSWSAVSGRATSRRRCRTPRTRAWWSRRARWRR